MTSGEPCISLACRDVSFYEIVKMPRRRYEVSDEPITCLTCLGSM